MTVRVFADGFGKFVDVHGVILGLSRSFMVIAFLNVEQIKEITVHYTKKRADIKMVDGANIFLYEEQLKFLLEFLEKKCPQVKAPYKRLPE